MDLAQLLAGGLGLGRCGLVGGHRAAGSRRHAASGGLDRALGQDDVLARSGDSGSIDGIERRVVEDAITVEEDRAAVAAQGRR